MWGIVVFRDFPRPVFLAMGLSLLGGRNRRMFDVRLNGRKLRGYKKRTIEGGEEKKEEIVGFRIMSL